MRRLMMLLFTVLMTTVLAAENRSDGFPVVVDGVDTRTHPVLRHAPVVLAIAKKYGNDPIHLLAMIDVESRGNANAVNAESGATGLTQIKVSTARDYDPGATGTKLKNPHYNLDIAAQHLRQLATQIAADRNLQRQQGMDLMNAAWYSGFGNVKRAGGIPNQDRVRTHVSKVRDKYQKYSDLLDGQTTTAAPVSNAAPMEEVSLTGHTTINGESGYIVRIPLREDQLNTGVQKIDLCMEKYRKVGKLDYCRMNWFARPIVSKPVIQTIFNDRVVEFFIPAKHFRSRWKGNYRYNLVAYLKNDRGNVIEKVAVYSHEFRL